jgi:hypothetical protein
MPNATNLSSAWEDCTSLASFPVINLSSATNLSRAWYGCRSLTSFPLLSLPAGQNYASTWDRCILLTSFPAIDFSAGTSFQGCWAYCESLVDFPAGVFDNCLATNFQSAWFGCSLSQQSVDNILISLDAAGQVNGSVDTSSISGFGSNSPPGPSGLAAKANLIAKGWTVTTN